jgi:hypothetical protein
MFATILIAANMCKAASRWTFRNTLNRVQTGSNSGVTLEPATGMLVIYSPGYEEQQAQFMERRSSAVIPFAERILCVKAIGGPFDFNIEVMPVEGVE